jgi:hypothetical protein
MEKTYSIKDIIFSLLGGNIEPCGDSAFDRESFERLQELIEILKDFHMKIDGIATKYKDSQYASEKRSGILASQYLDWLGISNFSLHESWRDPRKDLPEISERVLVWTSENHVREAVYSGISGFSIDSGTAEVVKFWMKPEDLIVCY